jgi:hypothetical protein
MCGFFIFTMNCYDTVLICKIYFNLVPNEKELILKETSANLYSIVMYYFARLLMEIPGFIVPAVVCSFIVYFFADLDMGTSHILIFGNLPLI